MKNIIIEIVRESKRSKWHSRIKTGNGEIVWSGENYKGTYCSVELTVRRFLKLLQPGKAKVKIIDGKVVKIVKGLEKK